MTLTLTTDRSDAAAILSHLAACDAGFTPRLSTRVDLASYAAKLAAHALRFEAWDGADLIGLVAIYANAPDRDTAFVSNVSLTPAHQGQGLARRLLSAGLAAAGDLGFARAALQVGADNAPARGLYDRLGFKTVAQRDGTVDMEVMLKDNA